MSEVLKAIAERSSIRAYTADKLTQEEIRLLLTAGMQAPTARNMQEIHFTVLDGENPVLAEIEAEKRAVLAAGAEERDREGILHAPHNFYYEAPTVFILSVDKDFSWSKLDAGIAVENIALAAQALGLGSVILGIIKGAMEGEKKMYFAQKLNFPENYEFAIAIAVGHKNTEKVPHDIDFEKSVSFVR